LNRFFALLVGFVLLVGTASAQVTKQDISTARKSIEDAQAKYQRLQIGNVPRYFYAVFGKEYGFEQADHIEVIATLFAGSIKAAKTKKALAAEFHRIARIYDNGLLLTYIQILDKYGLDSRLSAKEIDGKVTDTADRRLLSTALLLDSIATAWYFMVGYVYYQQYGEQLKMEDEDVDGLRTQQQIDQLLRKAAAEVAKATAGAR
jgi:hypothetical protein